MSMKLKDAEINRLKEMAKQGKVEKDQQHQSLSFSVNRDDQTEYKKLDMFRERNPSSIKFKKAVNPSSSKKSLSSLGAGVYNKFSDEMSSRQSTTKIGLVVLHHTGPHDDAAFRGRDCEAWDLWRSRHGQGGCGVAGGPTIPPHGSLWKK